jgi:hypothetical protein
MNKELLKSILWRFIRGGIAGAVSTMIVLLPLSATSWREVGVVLASLGVAGTIGGISGLILAIDKYCRGV